MPPPINDATRQAVLTDVDAGQMSRGEIARAHRISAWSVGNIAKKAGRDGAFSRERTKKATEAALADHAARLAALAGRNVGVAEQVLASFEVMPPEQWAEVSVHARAVVLGIVQDKALALAPPTDGAEEGRRRIVEFMDGLRAGVAAVPVADVGQVGDPL